MAVGILGLMVAVLVMWCVFYKYPYIPVDPVTLAGTLYYVCDSRMTTDLGRVGDATPGMAAA
jgi:hypothetical protein